MRDLRKEFELKTVNDRKRMNDRSRRALALIVTIQVKEARKDK